MPQGITIVIPADETVRERLLESLHSPRVRYLIRRSGGAEDFVGRGYEDALHELPE